MCRRKARRLANVLVKLPFRVARPRVQLQICAYLLIVRGALLLRRERWRRHRRGRRLAEPGLDGVARPRVAQLELRRRIRRLLLLQGQRILRLVADGLTSGAAGSLSQEKMKPA
jgi:hypothetical protein